MTPDERAQLDIALISSLAAKAVWQLLAVTAASKGPATMRVVQEALFTAESKLEFDATMEPGTETGRISAAARDQIRVFRSRVADLAAQPVNINVKPMPDQAEYLANEPDPGSPGVSSGATRHGGG